MKKSLYLLGGLAAYLAFGVFVTLFFTHAAFSTLFFVWNVILAYLPFLFAELLQKHMDTQRRKLPVVVLLAFLWLIFFPNAPYMITDLIHLGGSGYSDSAIRSFSNWVSLIYIASGAVFAILMGLASLDIIHTLLRKSFGRPGSNLIMALVFPASGFAIYIGRVLRFNSWDILRPFSMLERIREDFSAFSVAFSLLLSAFIFAAYVVFWILIHTAAKRPEGQS